MKVCQSNKHPEVKVTLPDDGACPVCEEVDSYFDFQRLVELFPPETKDVETKKVEVKYVKPSR